MLDLTLCPSSLYCRGAFPSAEHTFSSEKPSAMPAAVKLYSVAGRE